MSELKVNGGVSRYLMFQLGAESYAIPLLSVREVMAMPEITPIPHSPAHFLGIINLRGQVISVVDMRKKLGIKPVGTAETSVIICDLGGSSNMGIVVDSIESVLAVEDARICPAPESAKGTDYMSGVYNSGEKLVVLIDVCQALGEDQKRSA